MINALELTRRKMLLLGATAFTSPIARNVQAAQDSERHGVSAFGDLKYPPDFKHFDYVNPNAPKGGVFSHVGATRIFNQICSPSIRSTASSSGAMPSWGSSSPSRA